MSVSCTGSAATCSGHVTLTAKLAVRGHRTRTVTIATAAFTIAAGRTSSVRLRLSALGRSLLHGAHGHLSAQILLIKSAPAPSQEQRRTIRLTLRRH